MVKKINPLSDLEFDRLLEAISWSQRQLTKPRERRISAIREYVGSHYAEGGTDEKVPVGFLKLAIDIYVRLLAPQAPRALITTKQYGLKPTAADLELAVNEIPEEIHLADTMRRLVTEALFSVGILKIGLHTVGEVLGHKYGESFVDVITLDDFFLDMAAKRFDQIQFCGNDYWPLYEDACEDLGCDRDEIQADDHALQGEDGVPQAGSISIDTNAQEFKKRLWLRDTWLPKERLFLTHAVTTKKLLRTIEWEGPETGPYPILGYSVVPGNLLPLAPVSMWRDLNELANALFRKLGKQADAEKTVQGFPGGNEEAVLAFQAATDGDGILYSGGKPELLKAGGINNSTLMFFLQCRDLYSYFAGNLDSLGGLAPMTETVGQDKLLNEAAGAQLRDMAGKTIDLMREVFRSLAWYEWHDPVKSRVLEKKLPGADTSILVDWNRETRQGDFDVYDLDIDVFSMQDNSPSLRLRKLGMILQQYVFPLMPAIQEQGGQLDVQKILKDVSKYADAPEVSEWITFVQDVESQKGGQPRAPMNTTRTSVRVGKPGMTEQGKNRALQTALMAGGAGTGVSKE